MGWSANCWPSQLKFYLTIRFRFTFHFQLQFSCTWSGPKNIYLIIYFPEFCNDKPEIGTCRGSFEKWYFDTESGGCKTFIYGGCDGNQNNFETQDQCEKSCQIFEKVQTKIISSAESDFDDEGGICELEYDIGPCRASVPRYFFNSESLKCELFIYGGCSGNQNNFENAEDCEKTCFLNSL